MNQPRFIAEPARNTPVLGEYEVVVLGGGPAGITAAVAAARAGRSTLLIERYGFLGGMGTAAGVTNFCGLHANVHGQVRQVVHGIAADLLARMAKLGGLNAPHSLFKGKLAAQAYDNAAFKIAADDIVTGSGASLLFHAQAAGMAMRSPSEIEAILVETKSGRGAVVGQRYIACSGDTAAKKPDRVARQRHPAQQSRWHGSRRHRCCAIELGRGAGAAPDCRIFRLSARVGAGLRKFLHP
jgi:hypothetical protein